MIEAFIRAIEDYDLRLLANHWNQARGTKTLPAWRDIRPREISHQLPITWSYTYRKDEDTFTGRLAGDRIEAIVGRSFRGKDMGEIFVGSEYEWLHMTCKRVVIAKLLHCGGGIVTENLHALGSGERIIMPLSSDSISADGVLGATVYPTLGLQKPSFDFYDRENWFPIRSR